MNGILGNVKTGGFGLLEFMLVLAIAIALILASFTQYTRMQWNRKLAVLKNSEAMLQQATLMYWYSHCGAGMQPGNLPWAGVVDMLQPANTANIIQNPWLPAGAGQAFTITAQQQPDSDEVSLQWIFTVSTQIDLPDTAVAAIAANLNATAAGQRVTWTFTPTQYPSKTDANLGIIAANYDGWTMNAGNSSGFGDDCLPVQKANPK